LGKDVHLDADNSINGAIRKIRQVLKDDAEEPRFIQTITGKGYRFIAPVITPVSGFGAVRSDPNTFSPTATPIRNYGQFREFKLW
jgi:DNA-binding winged helix-turn-helix (wHTH) protein